MMEIQSTNSEVIFNPKDLETAFRYKSDAELRRTRFVFSIIRYPWLVSLFSKAIVWALQWKLPVKGLIRQTLFKVFIAGENLDQAIGQIKFLQRFQVHAVLDYVAEGEQDDRAFEFNKRTITQNIQHLSEVQGHHCISLKLSGLADVKFMSGINSNLENLSETDRMHLDKVMRRVDELCEAARRKGICVYFDAETYSTQKVYDYIAERMMEKHNLASVCVYNTLQMYLRDRLEYLAGLLSRSDEKNYVPGIKLVRGAYVEFERGQALKNGYPDPVWSSKDETDKSFDEAIRMCLDERKIRHLCLATHNEPSIRLALKLIKNKTDAVKFLKFSQLYGMSDNLSFNLAFAGMDVSKYLPYGEIDKAVPYMVRRAEENTSIGSQTSRELDMLDKEWQRRKDLKMNKRFHG